MLTDALIVAARSGDRHAVNAFVAACVPVARIMCHRVLGESSFVEDATQEALIKIWRNLDRYKSGNLVNWVSTIATNAARDMQLSVAYRQCDSLDDMHAASDDDTVQAVINAIDAEWLRSTLAEMAHVEIGAAATWLVYIDGHKVGEAAQMLGVPLKVVYNETFRTKQKLQRMAAGMGES